MAESFGTEFTIVEVSARDGSAGELWIALAKPAEALTLVLAAAPEGWNGEVLVIPMTAKQQELFEALNLKPGDVCRLTSR
ncbi:hypothetical protein JQ596_29170 [Bradyrhizobium manausense]|uniref:hypothetical protein n=1 Tax=Bradyrhizobium TaxID=374 RepID=UPI001BA70E6A|nr:MULTISPECIES: hypothetical protein [Bradyrhizobium]MBR0829611.1 hypothetical protein [Bradyrhizobium manausense]UVO25235.1 hypothetical protein KUF59_21705 [Bradyrhizobium arachidis]